jgi:phage FluMu protein Com
MLLCPRCKQRDEVTKNGFFEETKKYARTQRFRCGRCGKDLPKDTDPNFEKKAPSLDLQDRHLRAIAIYITYPIPLEHVASLTSIKRETFPDKLMDVFVHGLWDEMQRTAINHFPKLNLDDLDELYEICEKQYRGEEAFRCAGQLRGKHWRELSEEAQTDLLAKATLEFQ